jgi:hypothetical protein
VIDCDEVTAIEASEAWGTDNMIDSPFEYFDYLLAKRRKSLQEENGPLAAFLGRFRVGSMPAIARR